MCNAKAVGMAIIGVAAVYTGGAALGLLGAEAAAGGAAAAGTAAAGAGAAGATTVATAAEMGAAFQASMTAAGVSSTATGAMTAGQTAALYASMAGAGVSAYGQYQQAQAMKDAANYNRKVAEIQAADARDRGAVEQEQLGRKIGALRGQQTANMAANGLDLSSGTPAALLAQTDYYGLEDQRTLATNIEREASGFGNRARLAGMQADGIDPWMSAGGSLLSNAGAVADRWYKYKG